MNLLANIQSRHILSILVALMLPIFISCQSEYTTQHFSFPPGSKPHENDWEYTAIIIVSSNKSPITKKSNKNVQIKVFDRSNATFLKDDFEFISASIDANVIWGRFDEIIVELFEVGNKYAKDSYNKQLLKSGPNLLLKLTYQYDRKSKKFKRKLIEELH